MNPEILYENTSVSDMLRDEISQWQEFSDGSCNYPYVGSSPLCITFYFNTPQCDGCPISAHTGKRCCNGTPKDFFLVHEREVHPMVGYSGIFCNECVAICDFMVEFLNRVLEESS